MSVPPRQRVISVLRDHGYAEAEYDRKKRQYVRPGFWVEVIDEDLTTGQHDVVLVEFQHAGRQLDMNAMLERFMTILIGVYAGTYSIQYEQGLHNEQGLHSWHIRMIPQ